MVASKLEDEFAFSFKDNSNKDKNQGIMRLPAAEQPENIIELKNFQTQR